MTDFRMRLIIETILKDEKLLKQLKKDLEGVDTAADKSKKGLKGFKDNFKSLAKGIGIGIAALAAFGIAAKKAFDFTQEGAEIITLTTSFNRFLEMAGAAPDLLDQLKDASHGTIPEFEMMSSTMTLVMGTTGQLRDELLAATPQLMEMAKASNKLNPALGSTTFLYESLARGIKRSAPLILDNLGVVIKVGEAYQTFADKMGLSVKGLTAVQKSQAVLAAALKAGIPLVEQAGDSTEAYSDSWKQLSAHIIDSKNALLSWLAEVAKPFVETVDKLLFSNTEIHRGIEQVTKSVLEGSIAYDDYEAALAAVEAGTKSSVFITDINIVSQKELNEKIRNFGENSFSARQAIVQLTIAEVARVQELELHKEVQESLTGKVLTASEALQEAILTEQEAADAADLLAKNIENANKAFAKAREEFGKDPFAQIETSIANRISGIMDAMDFAEAGGQEVANLVTAVNTALFDNQITEQQARELWNNLFIAAQAVEVDLGNIKFEEAAEEIAEQFSIKIPEAAKLLEEAIPIDALQTNLDTAVELTAGTVDRMMVAINERLPGGEERLNAFLGNVETTAKGVRATIAEQFEVAESDILLLEGAFRKVTEETIKTTAGVEEIRKAIEALDDKIVTITIKTLGGIPDIEGTPAFDKRPSRGQAHGLNMTIPPGFPNDSFFLPLNVQSGEVVTVTPQGKTVPTALGGQGDIHFNAPLYLNSEANMSIEEIVRTAIPTHNI